MNNKVFTKLSLKVIEATKEAIMIDLYNNEMDSFDEFETLAEMDFDYFENAYILADHINFLGEDINDNDIKCLTTLQECMERLSDCFTMYEGHETTTDLGEYKPFESEQQMNDYLNYLRNKINSIR